MSAPYSNAGMLLEKARRLAGPHTTLDDLLADVLALNSNDQVARGECNDIAKQVVGEYAERKRSNGAAFPVFVNEVVVSIDHAALSFCVFSA